MNERPESNASNDLCGSTRERKRAAKESVVAIMCSCGCGTELQRPASRLKPGSNHYKNAQHAGAHRSRLYIEDLCGPWIGVVMEFLDGFARHHYKDLSTVRTAICPFILFLNERGIEKLEVITPKTITEFLSWSEEVEYKNAAHNISVLTSFFKWAIREGDRKSPCPVSPKFHGHERRNYLPRPYSATEMAFIWHLAVERGSARARAVLAIGEAAGLRLAEICRLRLTDVDLEGLRLFVRLPNKTNCERWALITDRAVPHIEEWLAVRNPDCEHNALFHNSRGDVFLPEALHAELSRILCKSFQGKTLHLEGLEQWSTHRLRHTMASNLASGGASLETIMASGGWKSPSSMAIYTAVEPQRVREEYDEAMRKQEEQAANGSSLRVLSGEEFLARYAP